MSGDEFEEFLEGDEADTLMVRRTRRMRRRPWTRRTKARTDEFNRKRAARAKEIAAQVEPVDGKCPEGYHLDWALRPILLPGMVGMPAPRKVCQPDKQGITPTIPSIGQCGTRSEGKGITWGRILPQFRRLSMAERQAVVDKMCGRKPTPPVPVVPDEVAYKELAAKHNAALSKYNLLVTERKTIIDQYKRKNAEIATARRVIADIERQMKRIPRPIGLPSYRR